MAELNLDLAGYDPVGSDLASMPPGDYEVLIASSRLRESLRPAGFAPEAKLLRKGLSTGADAYSCSADKSLQLVEFELVVLGPVCRGTRLRETFTLGDEASLRRMKSFAVAVRCPDPDFIGDTEELHGLRCRVWVQRVCGSSSSRGKNVISGYMPSAANSFSGRFITERINAARPECSGQDMPGRD